MPLNVPEIYCLSPQVKTAIQKEITGISDVRERQQFLALLNEMSKCPDGSPIGFYTDKDHRQSKGKRAPSKYNMFVKECLEKGQGETFKECAIMWKKRKGT